MTKKNTDEYDRKIITELVRDPKLSDNQISRITGIPVKTVNRKRKSLENGGIINYYLGINTGPEGTGDFDASIMYMVTFRYGIYRKQFIDNYKSGMQLDKAKHIFFKMLGESDGRLILLIMLKSRKYTDILEIFNVEIVEKLKQSLGHDCIAGVRAIPISQELSLLHNYEPLLNMKQGKINPHWPKEKIFVSDA